MVLVIFLSFDRLLYTECLAQFMMLVTSVGLGYAAFLKVVAGDIRRLNALIHSKVR